MSAQIICNGRVVWRTPGPQLRRPELPRDREGNVLLPEAIPPESPQSVFRAGTPHFSQTDRIWYRVLTSCPPIDGWASTDFWQDRWSVDHKAVLDFATAGFLDPAMEEGSKVSRYRCRDEYGLKISRTWKAAKNRLIRMAKIRRKIKREGEHEHD